MIEHLKKLSPETIEAFIETRDREALGIPSKLASYILQLNDATILHRKYSVVAECARHLQALYPELSIPTCKSRIYDSINYLNDNCSVVVDAWHLHYADMYLKLFEVALTGHDFKEARVCLDRSRECRIKASAGVVDPERTKFKHQIVSPDIVLERMGVKPQGLLKAYERGLFLISRQDATDKEKKRQIGELGMELNVKDIEYEEV